MKDEADIVTETLHETEPVKVLERRREALEKFYEAKQREDEDEGRASPATEASPPKELPATTTQPARGGGSWKRVRAAAVVAVLSPFAVILGGQIKEMARKTAPSAGAASMTLDPSLAVGASPSVKMVMGAGPRESVVPAVDTAPSASAALSTAATAVRSGHPTAVALTHATAKPPEARAEPPDAGAPPVDPTPRPPPSVFVGGQKPEFN